MKTLKETVRRIAERLNRRLSESYGLDQLSGILMLAGMACIVASSSGRLVWGCLAVALAGCASWRMLSCDHARRRQENEVVTRALMKPVHRIRRQRSKWRNRKTRAYVRCPACHEEYALPKGRGTLRATCPHCGEKSVHTV